MLEGGWCLHGFAYVTWKSPFLGGGDGGELRNYISISIYCIQAIFNFRPHGAQVSSQFCQSFGSWLTYLVPV